MLVYDFNPTAPTVDNVGQTDLNPRSAPVVVLSQSTGQMTAHLGRKQSQQSSLARLVMSRPPISPPSEASSPKLNGDNTNTKTNGKMPPPPVHHGHDALLPPPAISGSLAQALRALNMSPNVPSHSIPDRSLATQYDSPYARSVTSTAPTSPRMPPIRQNSGSQTPRVRPHATTLNIPGMTRSRVSPDGRIAERDVAAKVVIIMVGLPARGKSYITKKIHRYLSWQQHNTRIFNVGNRRRQAAGVMSPSKEVTPHSATPVDEHVVAASILLNGVQPPAIEEPTNLDLNSCKANGYGGQPIDQNAGFFDPKNDFASKLREQVAMDTLDELLDYLLLHGGSAGILDATNSTQHRRDLLVAHIKQREPKLGILFIESVCNDKDLLEANMRLKLSGPDYKDKDPRKSLEDFKARVRAYESAYEPLGSYEEKNQWSYIQMIDVGKKMVNHRTGTGFLVAGIGSYLMTFNLSPRTIWVTRHGQSEDNTHGKLGGDSPLTERGHLYGQALHNFITFKRKEWLAAQKSRIAHASFPPLPGDHTPPYPQLNHELEEKNFCVWTSMLKRSAETAEHFEADEDYDVKAFEMLNELNAGSFEGMTYDEIATKYPEEYHKRAQDKLHYIYPGVGGEGYLQIINRLREMVQEIERVTDHVLIISHRSVCRVLMAYFMDLTRDDIADLDVPLGMLYAIEPKPYGIEFHAYRYDETKGWFEEMPDYKPQRTVDRNN